MIVVPLIILTLPNDPHEIGPGWFHVFAIFDYPALLAGGVLFDFLFANTFPFDDLLAVCVIFVLGSLQWALVAVVFTWVSRKLKTPE